MLIFNIFLLPTAILASGIGQYGRYQGDIQNKGFDDKPGSNIIYNFEQIRRDQPPQIEMRDESIANYMYRRPAQTTTTTEEPIVITGIKHTPQNDVLTNRYDQFPKFSTLPPVPNGQYNPNPMQWTPMPPPPPPPAPKWDDFSEVFKQHSFPHFETPNSNFDLRSNKQVLPAVPDFSHFQLQPHQKPITSLINENGDNHNSAPRPSNLQIQSSAPEYKTRDGITGNQEIERRGSTAKGHNTSSAGNRGNHKFNWNDITTPVNPTQYQQASSTAVPVNQSKNPPPIPTLTPWIDSFGK